jgi:hypothetical protein
VQIPRPVTAGLKPTAARHPDKHAVRLGASVQIGHHGAPPWCSTVIFRRFEKRLLLKDFSAVGNRWRRGRPPYRRSYDIDFIDSIFNIKSLGTRLYTRRSRLSVASVVQRRTARCNYIVNGPPINLLDHSLKIDAPAVSKAASAQRRLCCTRRVLIAAM